jgi:hypothetical protein
VKDTGDPFNIDELIKDATAAVDGGGGGGSSAKRYGVQESEPRSSKRVKVGDDDG